MDNRRHRMVWIDLEMTGLDITKESIIEIATVVTDGDLNVLATGPNLAVRRTSRTASIPIAHPRARAGVSTSGRIDVWLY